MPRRCKVYRGLDYRPVNTYPDCQALRCEKARVLSGANMGTRPRRIEGRGAGPPSQNPNDHLKALGVEEDEIHAIYTWTFNLNTELKPVNKIAQAFLRIALTPAPQRPRAWHGRVESGSGAAIRRPNPRAGRGPAVEQPPGLWCQHFQKKLNGSSSKMWRAISFVENHSLQEAETQLVWN